jgi:hypothetical protein
VATFAVGQAITTRESSIAVDAGLAVGEHRFQLVVVDSAGLRSAPALAVVSVTRGVITQPGPILSGPILSQPVPSQPAPTPTSPVLGTPTTSTVIRRDAPRPPRTPRSKKK